MIFHTSVPYGVRNVEQTVEQLQPELIAEAEKMFPNWPKPDHIKCQKWRYSQVKASAANLILAKPAFLEYVKQWGSKYQIVIQLTENSLMAK